MNLLHGRYRMSHFILLLFIISAELSSAQNFNRPTPGNFAKYEFNRLDTTNLNGYYLMAPHHREGNTAWIYGLSIMDEDGYVVWWTGLNKKGFDFKYHPAINQYSYTERKYGNVYHTFLDHNFEKTDSITAGPAYNGDMHEIQVLDNGHKLILGIDYVNQDLSGYTFNGTQGSANTILADAVILEYDSNNNVIWEWKGRDHLSIDMFIDDHIYNPNGFDYLHANSIEQTPSGDILVSFRNANALVEIDKVSGNVNWILGGNNNQFSFPNDSGFLGQHDARVSSDGTISVFDNQLWGTSISRGVNYQLDTVNMIATKTSEFLHPNTAYGRIMGNYTSAVSDSRIISWGGSYRPNPSVSLVNNSGDLVSEYYFEDTLITYRAFFSELNSIPERPEINCNYDGINLELSGPSSDFYLWSTGEATQSIIVADTGTYVLWVNQGIGAIGSLPYYISDISEACPNANIEAIELNDQVVEGYYSIQGKRLSTKPKGTVFLTRYESGKVVRSFSKE